MRAMRLIEYNTDLVPVHAEKPRAERDEVLVKVAACGVCRTDLKIITGQISTVRLPHILGHEISGIVDEIGPDVQNFAVGDRVVVIAATSCGDCWYCRNGFDNHCEKLCRIGYERNGGYAEYVTCPARNVYKVPDTIDLIKASIITDAIATPLHALHHRAHLRAGELMVLIGVGGEGGHTLQLAKAMGAYVIAIDIDERRGVFAKELGADEFYLFDEAASKKDVLKKYGVDLIFDTVGIHDTIHLGLSILRPMGRFIMLGYQPSKSFHIDQYEFVMREHSLIGIRGATLIDTAEAITMVERGQVTPIVSETFLLHDANEAIDALKNNRFLGRCVLIL